MDCKYIFNETVYDSYQDLTQALEESEINKVFSILYSLQDENVAKILELKKDYAYEKWTKNTFNGIDIEPSISSDKNMSIQQFIDSDYFSINGKSPIFKLVFSEYLKNKKEELIKDKHMSDQEADTYINLLKDRWEIIADDAFDLHKLLVSLGKKDQQNYYEMASNVVDTSFEAIPDKVLAASNEIIRQVFLKNGTDKTGSGKKG
jgi:hypothetical protein